ncbi:hypothetical protein SteCoe_30509 [Stentor coeruleus]|uniref:Uncharacterized protein n=1 Tax=Stentor coeruleus TaxID=5963 RepID=A0A1R2B3X5_9CILI|nr:hypothetical protein SteCoe_30509 [Stentor coeruleus]
MSIQNLRNKSFLNKNSLARGTILAKLKPKSLKEQDTDLINQTVSLKKVNSAFTDGLNSTLSPTVTRFTFSTYSHKISKLESKLLFRIDQDPSEKISAAFSVMEDLIVINPELTTLLTKVKSILEEYIQEVKNTEEILQKNLNNTSEDLKRLTKRYKKLAIEALDSQAQVKKRRNAAFELKKERKELKAELAMKNEEILKLEKKIESLETEVKEFQMNNKVQRKVYKNHLYVHIPKKSLDKFGIGSSQASPIDLGTEINIAPGAHDEIFSPLLIQIPE